VLCSTIIEEHRKIADFLGEMKLQKPRPQMAERLGAKTEVF
jgi:hypothetical protein